MCEQTEIDYLDGDVVWVKLGSCWWPGEVVGPARLPPDVLPSFRKPPIAVVKFFQETTYEYVKNINSIYKYNCSRKTEFINKGLYMYRTKHGHMEKFPEDVIRAETAVGGDIEILTRDEFQEVKKESYAGIFGEAVKRTPVSGKKGRSGRGRPPAESPKVSTPTRKLYREKSDYKVHILLQGSKEPLRQSTETASTPSTSRANSEPAEEKPQKVETPATIVSTPTVSSSGIYSCPSCSFSTSRLNVLIMHNKTHSATFTPYTPSPVRKKTTPKSSKSTAKTLKMPKSPRPKKEKTEKTPKKTSQGKKRSADEKAAHSEVKKPKTDQEIKSSLLADWEDVDEESNDESSTMVTSQSPEIPIGAESPAAPTPAELSYAQVPVELSAIDKKDELSTEKPESSSDSKYEFCEDEDWPIESDGGRKIPRVKNPSKRKDETKSLSIDEDDVAKEVAELLTKTTVPELPSVPEPLKAEENFPEPPVIKSPDKKPENSSEMKEPTKMSSETKPTKAIFKTKTFFRSRHSRSQDAIGKYVAEQLNAAERMDMSEGEINGSEVASSPEARESPPVEHVKVARLAPKIQLKKMKAEAAQLREKEKSGFDQFGEDMLSTKSADIKFENAIIPLKFDFMTEKDEVEISKSSQDVLYPTQEIKPINKELPDKLLHKEENKEYHTKIFDHTEKESRSIVRKSNTTPDPENKSGFNDESLSIPERIPDKLIMESEQFPSPEQVNETSLEKSYQDLPQITTEETFNDPKLQESHEQTTTEIYEKSNVLNLEQEHSLSQETPSSVEELHVIIPQKSYDRQTVISASTNPNAPIEPSPKLPAAIEKQDKQIEEPNISTSNINLLEPSHKTYDQPVEPYMSESTASAVDALLSVSRETDRVPRIVSDDPPEDLFEDDNKENGTGSDINTINDDANVNNVICDDNVMTEPEKTVTEEKICDLNGITNQEVSPDDVIENVIIEDVAVSTSQEDSDNNVITESTTENIPSESDLQIAETLINLPSTAIQNKSNEHLENASVPMCLENEQIEEEIITTSETVIEENNKIYESKINETVSAEVPPESLIISNKDNLNLRYETEQEKSENLNAAQSLVQMSESIDHKINIVENNEVNKKEVLNTSTFKTKRNNGLDITNTVEQKVALLSSENNSDPCNGKSPKFETTSSKLLKILEEPSSVKVPIHKTTPIKQVIVTGKEKILNFDVAKSPLKAKTPIPKQKIIIRRSATNKNIINNLNEVIASPDKIILSRNKTSQDGSSIQTYTIQTSQDPISGLASKDPKQIIIQPKIRKITKPSKLQKIKPQNSLITQLNETKTLNETTPTDEPIFDINSMPVVLSDDILTPESIEKMPIVMSDGNIITNTPNPPKLVKTKPAIIENEKVAISPVASKPEVKTLLMNTTSDVTKVTTPNILSKSSKLRGAKPMLVIDKATGKQKIIMTKAEPAVKEIKPAPAIIQSMPQSTAKAEKFIILPTANSPRAGRTQKIVIDPQTGKAHVLVAKGQDTSIAVPENKPVSAKLIPSSSDANTPGNTVMIITNAQGAQSRIVLTPEHEKILFPNKQQPNVSQLKTITHRITTNTGIAQKAVVTTTAPVKTHTRIVPKQQKSAIITSKGQLIVGGRVTTTSHNIAPMPEIRPAPKRIIASEPKKLVQAIQKNTSEPLIFLQQKSGAVMQLTAAQFEHLQRTGQIIHKPPAPVPENKIIVQKSITISPKETVVPTVQKQRVRKAIAESSTPVKKLKQEIAIAPSPVPSAPVPPLTLLSNPVPTATVTISSLVPSVSNTVSVATTPSYSDLENFEELLPSTAIARQSEPKQAPVAPPPEPMVTHPQPQIEPVPEPPSTQISDGQLLAVPGENFGGPLGSFYLCMEDNGTLTPIDNRPLVLENNQLVPMAVEPLPVFAPQPERRDILEAALANSDVFHAEATRDEAPDFRDLNANVSVHCRVSETSTTLNQPIMTPVEVPTKCDAEPAVPSNLEDGLAVIGVTPHMVPTSLELPITVTDPRIAPKTTDPLSNSNYRTSILPSPNTDMTFVTTEEAEVPVVGPISMPLLTDEESVGKSMPILTDEVAERTVSSVESGGSPSSIDVRESEADDGGQWTRRLLTPGSDTSETSAEIPLQPVIQLSVNDLSRHS